MRGSPFRSGPRAKFGRHRAIQDPLRVRKEPEEEPEVSPYSEGRGEEQGLSERKVRDRLAGVSFSVLLGWGVYQWGKIAWR